MLASCAEYTVRPMNGWFGTRKRDFDPQARCLPHMAFRTVQVRRQPIGCNRHHPPKTATDSDRDPAARNSLDQRSDRQADRNPQETQVRRASESDCLLRASEQPLDDDPRRGRGRRGETSMILRRTDTGRRHVPILSSPGARIRGAPWSLLTRTMSKCSFPGRTRSVTSRARGNRGTYSGGTVLAPAGLPSIQTRHVPSTAPR